MWATTLQVTLMIGLPACLVWVAMRSAKRSPTGRRAEYPSGGDDTYNLVHFNAHDGSGSHHSGADFSGSSGDSASGGDGGGGGGSSD